MSVTLNELADELLDAAEELDPAYGSQVIEDAMQNEVVYTVLRNGLQPVVAVLVVSAMLSYVIAYMVVLPVGSKADAETVLEKGLIAAFAMVLFLPLCSIVGWWYVIECLTGK